MNKLLLLLIVGRAAAASTGGKKYVISEGDKSRQILNYNASLSFSLASFFHLYKFLSFLSFFFFALFSFSFVKMKTTSA